MNAFDSLRVARRRLAASRWWLGAGRFWRSVRPTTRRGTALGVLAIIIGAMAMAIVFFVGSMVLWSPYVESIVKPDGDARAWAALQPSYAGSTSCSSCHAIEAAKASTAGHAGIGCESCHGPQIDHALASPGTPEVVAAVALPTDDLCTRCHTATDGRPASVRQIVPSRHYVLACLQCHDPHTAIAARPPVVVHPLENLPPCITCHGPDGFKARNQRHPVVSGDEPCLACHAPGRGPTDRDPLP